MESKMVIRVEAEEIEIVCAHVQLIRHKAFCEFIVVSLLIEFFEVRTKELGERVRLLF